MYLMPDSQSMSKLSKIVIFIIAITVVVLVVIWSNTKITTTEQKPVAQDPSANQTPVVVTKWSDLIKKDAKPGSLPDGFADGLVLYPKAQVKESYNFIDPKTGKNKEGIVVLESSDSLEVIKAYYTDKLKAPSFVPNENTGVKESSTLKVLTFSTKEGMVAVVIGKKGELSQIMLRDINLGQ